MNYEDLKDEIKCIVGLANGVPEKFREQCFELLMQHLFGFGEIQANHGYCGDWEGGNDKPKGDESNHHGSAAIPTPSQIRNNLCLFNVRPDINANARRCASVIENDLVIANPKIKIESIELSALLRGTTAPSLVCAQ